MNRSTIPDIPSDWLVQCLRRLQRRQGIPDRVLGYAAQILEHSQTYSIRRYQGRFVQTFPGISMSDNASTGGAL